MGGEALVVQQMQFLFIFRIKIHDVEDSLHFNSLSSRCFIHTVHRQT